MEHKPESMGNILQRINLDESLQTSPTIPTSRDNELSVYRGGQLTEIAVVRETEKILVAFPKIEAQMVYLLRERFKANKFNDERMTDAVNFVVDNYKGWDKLPSIGDFVSFDRTVKIFTYNELLTISKDYSAQQRGEFLNSFERIIFYDQDRWAKKEDVARYNLTKWVKK